MSERNFKRISSPEIIEKIALANDLYNQNNYEGALEIYNQVLPQVGNYYAFDKYGIYCQMGNSYYHLKDYDSSIKAYKNALKFFTNNPDIYARLGYMYFYRDSNLSNKYYLKSIELKPDITNFVMLTQTMIKSADYKPKDLKYVFEKYVDYFRPILMDGRKAFSYDKSNYKPDKKLRIGYLSSDFYHHAMMQFVRPILENHNRDKFEIHLYSCGNVNDGVTKELQNRVDSFDDCSELTPYETAEIIYYDDVDILVDLSGYTHKNQAIWTLLYKPAPIIVQFLGFLGTYGIKEVDYILCDENAIPQNMAKDYTEKPLYIKSGMNRHVDNITKLDSFAELPCLKNGYITFGSYNSLSKLNPYTVEVWSKVLKAIPTAKLLIYRSDMTDVDKERYITQFKDNGINLDRLIFENEKLKNYDSAYAKCDIALDAMPFSGLTITIAQAKSGVPTLTMPGDNIASTGTARVNRALGLDDFIASDENDYIKKAVELSENKEKLVYYRNNLASILKNSYLIKDYKTYVNDIEDLYVKIYQDWLLDNK